MKQNSIFSRFLAKLCWSASLRTAALTACCILIFGCAQAENQAPVPVVADAQGQPGSQSGQTEAGDAQAIRAQQLQLVKVPLTVTAPVKKMLKYDDRGLPHEKFLLGLSNGTTILVAHNTKMAPYVPIQAGDLVTVHGEFIWNAKGGLIHWTHHSDTPSHPGGYIDFQGKRYE